MGQRLNRPPDSQCMNFEIEDLLEIELERCIQIEMGNMNGSIEELSGKITAIYSKMYLDSDNQFKEHIDNFVCTE